jgi:putative transposase
LNQPWCGGFLCRVEYLGFGGKLHHEVPAWAGPGSRFHIRIRCASDNPAPLTTPSLAAEILNSARFYEARHIWHLTVFLLMPDHIHAILSFAPDRQMRRVVSDWKRYLARTTGITWQENFFDHQLRDDSQCSMKYDYILRNPVAAGLCEVGRDWPWKIA